MQRVPSLVPRPSPAPVFDRLQSVFAYCKRSKTGAGEGLGTRLTCTCISIPLIMLLLLPSLGIDTAINVIPGKIHNQHAT